MKPKPDALIAMLAKKYGPVCRETYNTALDVANVALKLGVGVVGLARRTKIFFLGDRKIHEETMVGPHGGPVGGPDNQ